MQFQSTLPRRERLNSATCSCSSIYFNPRSREGSDCYRAFISPHARISIHAPAKGATLCFLVCDLIIIISIHAPAKGATLCDPIKQKWKFYFNPRSREGSDAASIGIEPQIVISIHAPAKGATENRWNELFDSLFQSTLPRRERHFYK